MNTYEIRIDSSNFDTKKEYENIQAFSIGHESCIIKFIKIMQQRNLLDFVSEQRRLGKEIRIITPFIPESHLDEIKKTLNNILKKELFKDSVIIVNDFGLMNYIHRIEKQRIICMGRGLIFSFDYTPWGYKIFENESPEIQEVVSQVNFFDDEKMEFFKSYNVCEIEANLKSGTMESLKKIQSRGFKVNVHKDNFLYGVQRSCYIKRFNSGRCSEIECDEYSEKIELDKLWEATGYYKKTEDFYFPELYLRGNQICGKVYDLSYNSFDGVILSAKKIGGLYDYEA